MILLTIVERLVEVNVVDKEEEVICPIDGSEICVPRVNSSRGKPTHGPTAF